MKIRLSIFLLLFAGIISFSNSDDFANFNSFASPSSPQACYKRNPSTSDTCTCGPNNNGSTSFDTLGAQPGAYYLEVRDVMCDASEPCTVPREVAEVCADCDSDNDMFVDKQMCGGDDCDDNNNMINPEATENCTNSVDDDCDGDIDSNDDDCPSCEFEICWYPCQWSLSLCRCVGPGCDETPVILDILGNGFDLTDKDGGVDFDIAGNGVIKRISWTAASSDEAFLALDRNGNGVIDNGQEPFGDYTPQPYSSMPHGFLALAEYDKLVNGGNSDGRINSSDTIFPSLRLWQDSNHNGLSESKELFSLPALSVVSLDLRYKESKRTDQYGNIFRYRAKVYAANGSTLGRWAYDVFLVSDR